MSLSDRTLEIPCPGCKEKQTVRLGNISPGNKITCTGCGPKIEFTGDDPAAGAKQLDDALDRLKRLR